MLEIDGEWRMEKYRKEKTKSVRNLFLTYLFISLISGRPEIFAGICASFPFVIPVVFTSADNKAGILASCLVCGVPGILVAILYLLFSGTYCTKNWLVPAGFAFLMCILYTLIQKRLKPDNLITAKAVITVAVCFIAFI